jgi:hypothetical protein
VSGWDNRACSLGVGTGLDKLRDFSECRCQTIDPGILLHGTTTRLVIPVALDGAGLRGDLLTVEHWSVSDQGRSKCM